MVKVRRKEKKLDWGFILVLTFHMKVDFFSPLVSPYLKLMFIRKDGFKLSSDKLFVWFLGK